MSNKNMKILITPEQPLDEVVRELERLGFVKNTLYKPRKPNCIDVSGSMYSIMRFPFQNIKPNMTLAELKEMKND